ncbi:MAG: tRNA uridine(34) 5-carboxymethylaminomethyl modification radical SAM/GNAT enzyme Elp3 [Nanobdellota archaeon]
MYPKEFIRELRQNYHLAPDQFMKLKAHLCKKYGVSKIPTNIEIFLYSDDSQALMTKPTRSLSGVCVIAVMSKPYPCPHGQCSICPGGPDSTFGDTPQSYTGKEPATRRAIRNQYDGYLQVMNRLEQYVVTGHVPEKIELIVMGGTFPSFPKRYRDRFVRDCLMAMNDFAAHFFPKGKLRLRKFKEFFELPGDLADPEREKRVLRRLKALKRSSTLEDEQRRNERSAVRCVALVLETRPDYAKKRHAREMLRLGCTKVELGVQAVSDDLLERMNRGHTVQDSKDATRVLKDFGLKVTYHMMLGLPGATDDRQAFKEIFSNEAFKPDMLKIYPCMVLRGTRLYDEWKNGHFCPISTAEAKEVIKAIKRDVPPYVRINRIQRDIPTYMTEAGVDMTNLRQVVLDELKSEGQSCGCIRCREVGRAGASGEPGFRLYAYSASGGEEFFISVENSGLLGFCRLRFPSQCLTPEITTDCALIRELHVYGSALGIGKTGEHQHSGWGKKLLARAESIAKENGKRKIIIISGIGVRAYYRKLGYRRQGVYMVKHV